MIRAMLAADLAAEMGRSLDWLHANWRLWVKEHGLPEPISGDGRGTPLVWSAAQVWAWLDRKLSPEMQAAAAAHRAAMAAYHTARVDHDSEADEANARARLEAKWAGKRQRV